MTKLLGVIGDPIAHSLSPLIHNGWYRDLGIDATYEAMQIPKGDLPDALQTLSKTGALGLNVTLPHKLSARDVATTTSETVDKIGAANTLTAQSDGTWHADNTDIPGFTNALRELLDEKNLSGLRVVLLGAGGSARAVLYALSLEGAEVLCLNRTESKAQLLVQDLGNVKCRAGDLNQYADEQANADIVINTTSSGYEGSALATGIGNGRLFYDISYGRAATPQLSAASESGWRTADGLSMLIAQAAESFRIWFGVMPDREKAIDRCRNAIKATV